MKRLFPIVYRLVCLALLSPVAPAFFTAALAEDIKVEARLIWGTDSDKSEKPKHKPVDEETAQKLRKIFKWKNYFLETTETAVVAHRQSKRIKLSQDCEVEIKELQGAPIEINTYGKGKLINKTTKSLNVGEWVVLGGDDKNQCAWFVILSRK